MQSAISIFGKDCPGVIAAITSVLIRKNVNIEDASMTILQGHFAMILVVQFESSVKEEIETELNNCELLRGFSISFSQNDLKDDQLQENEVDCRRYVLHLTVNDSPGIVARITNILGGAGANIVDCSTRKNNETQLFTMMLDVDVPTNSEIDIVESIEQAKNDLNGDVVFHKLEDIDL